MVFTKHNHGPCGGLCSDGKNVDTMTVPLKEPGGPTVEWCEKCVGEYNEAVFDGMSIGSDYEVVGSSVVRREDSEK